MRRSKQLSESVSGGQWGCGPCSAGRPQQWEGSGFPSQLPWESGCVDQARSHRALLRTSLYCICPLCPWLSFLTDTEGHIGWGDDGDGETGVGLLPSAGPGAVEPFMLWCTSPVHFWWPPQGPRQDLRGTEVSIVPVLTLTVCPQIHCSRCPLLPTTRETN